MLDFGLNGLLSLILKGPLRVVLIAESNDLISCMSWEEIPSAEGVEPEDAGADLVLEEGVAGAEVLGGEVGDLATPASGVAASFELFSVEAGDGVPLDDSDFKTCSSFFISATIAPALSSEFSSFLFFTPLIKDLTPETVFPRELSS